MGIDSDNDKLAKEIGSEEENAAAAEEIKEEDNPSTEDAKEENAAAAEEIKEEDNTKTEDIGEESGFSTEEADKGENAKVKKKGRGRKKKTEKEDADGEGEPEIKEEKKIDAEDEPGPKIYALRTTANREDQVMDFLSSNVIKKKSEVYSIIRPHGMRGYIFVEASKRSEAEAGAFNVPYSRGLLPNTIKYNEIEHMLEQVKHDVNIQKNDIAEIISGPFKREKCKVTRIDKTKDEIVVELLEAAVPIPITVSIDAVKVIRRDSDEPSQEDNDF